MKAKIKNDSGIFGSTIPIAQAGDIIEVEAFHVFPGAPASTEIVIANKTGLLFDVTNLEPIKEDEEERTLCHYCNGTNISPYERDGGSCPHCFGGYEHE